MIYLLDSDIMIFLIRGFKSKRTTKHCLAMRQQAENLVKHCKRSQANGDSVGVSAITVSELEYGARRCEQYDTEIEAVRKILLPFDLFDYDAISCADQYGQIRYEVEMTGSAIGPLDLLIAAHALSINATIVTNNEKHFRRIKSVAVENWTKAL